jgi:hypothetical protein
MPPCHGGGRGFESRPDRKSFTILTLKKIDPVVQLVRMPPCHGGGRGFESRPDRIKALKHFVLKLFFLFYTCSKRVKAVKRNSNISEELF